MTAVSLDRLDDLSFQRHHDMCHHAAKVFRARPPAHLHNMCPLPQLQLLLLQLQLLRLLAAHLFATTPSATLVAATASAADRWRYHEATSVS